MSFGLSAATIGAIGSVAGPVVGGLLGSQSGGGSQTTQQQIDPRIAKYIYGEDGNGGILADANAWYQQNKSGLNQQMIDGLNRQYSIYSDPINAQGYTNLANAGQSLLGGGVAANPFNTGAIKLNTGQGQSLLGGGPAQQPAQQASTSVLGAYQPTLLGNPATTTQAQIPFAASPAVEQMPQIQSNSSKLSDLSIQDLWQRYSQNLGDPLLSAEWQRRAGYNPDIAG